MLESAVISVQSQHKKCLRVCSSRLDWGPCYMSSFVLCCLTFICLPTIWATWRTKPIERITRLRICIDWRVISNSRYVRLMTNDTHAAREPRWNTCQWDGVWWSVLNALTWIFLQLPGIARLYAYTSRLLITYQ